MVTTATNHRPTTPTIPNNRMPKADKAAKKHAKRSEKPSGILDSSPELRNAVAAIEKQFGEGSIMPLSGDRLLPIEGSLNRQPVARHRPWRPRAAAWSCD